MPWITLSLLVSLHALEVQADNLSQHAGVTLELCGDVKAEEVQAALAIEYQGEEFGNTMLTVQCRGEFATLRIVGPACIFAPFPARQKLKCYGLTVQCGQPRPW